MDGVQLCADGRLFVDDRAFAGDALNLLGFALTLDPDCTLASVFRLVRRFPDLARLSEFWAILLPSGVDPDNPPPAALDQLVVVKSVEIIGVPAPPRVDVHTAVRGFMGGSPVGELKAWPVPVLLGVPLVLGDLTHSLLGDAFIEMRFAAVFTLFEVLDALAFQLSFHGAPSECAVKR